MSSPSRFGTTNLVATLQNGTGGGAPALVQDASFPMSNVLLNDRKVLWSTGTAGFPQSITLDLTLSAASTVSAIGLHGFRMPAANGITDIKFYTQVGAYAPAGTWVLQGTKPAWFSGIGGYPMFTPDMGVAFTPVASVVSVRVVFNTATGIFQMGKVFAGDPWVVYGSAVSDIGTRESTPQRNAVIYQLPSGATFMFNLGDNSRILKLQFGNITAAQRDLLFALAAQTKPFVHIDADGLFWDCIVSGKSIPTKQTAPTPLFTCSLDMLGIP